MRPPRWCLAVLVLLAALGGARAAFAHDAWPARPVRLVVAQAPGGILDQIARHLAERLTTALGVPVVVDFRGGAGGLVGTEHVARATPDGHTLLLATMSTHAVLPHVVASAPFDPVKDFVPIANAFSTVKALWISGTLPSRTFAEWTGYARARPGTLNYASGGVGSVNHVDADALVARLGLDCVHVPYNGPAPALQAVATGEVHWMVLSISAGLPVAASGRVRPLAVFSDRRSPLLPDVPTAMEAGVDGLDLRAWIGVMAPAGTPDAIVARVHDAIARTLRQPETVAWAERHALEVNAGSSADFARVVEQDVVRWRERIRLMRIAAP